MGIGIYSRFAGPASGESAQGRGQVDVGARKGAGKFWFEPNFLVEKWL